MKDENPRIRLSAIAVYYIFQECFKKARIIYDGKFEEDVWAATLISYLKRVFPDNSEINDWKYDTYLRDRFRAACNFINEGKLFDMKGYSPFKFEPLLALIEIENYDEINDDFKFRTDSPRFFIDEVDGSWLEAEMIKQFLRADREPAAPPPLSVIAVEEEPLPTVPEPILKSVEPILEPVEPIKIPCVYLAIPFGRFQIFPPVIEDEGHLYFYDNGDCEYKGISNFIIKKEDLIDKQAFRMPRDKKPFWVKVEYKEGQRENQAYFAAPETEAGPLNLLSPENILRHFKA